MNQTLSERDRKALLETIGPLRDSLSDLVQVIEILIASDRTRHEELQRVEQELNRIRPLENSDTPPLSSRVQLLGNEVSSLTSENEKVQEEMRIYQASELYARSPRPWKQDTHQTHSTDTVDPSQIPKNGKALGNGGSSPELVRLRKIERIAKAVVYHFLQGQGPGYGEALKAMGKTLAQ